MISFSSPAAAAQPQGQSGCLLLPLPELPRGRGALCPGAGERRLSCGGRNEKGRPLGQKQGLAGPAFHISHLPLQRNGSNEYKVDERGL